MLLLKTDAKENKPFSSLFPLQKRERNPVAMSGGEGLLCQESGGGVGCCDKEGTGFSFLVWHLATALY